MREEVEKVIEKLRPALGVNAVELVDVHDGIVQVRVFSSACHAAIPEDIIVTLLEEELIDEIPEITKVVAV
ncbi:NifU family protein [Chloroflexota bacterium]